MSGSPRTQPADGPEDDVVPAQDHPDDARPAEADAEVQQGGADVDAAGEGGAQHDEAHHEAHREADDEVHRDEADAESGEAAASPEPSDDRSDADDQAAAAGAPARRRRDPLAAALIGVLTLLLGFAFAVQVKNTGTDQVLAGAREEDLVRILDELNVREERVRDQIAEQRTALEQLTSSDSQSATALEEARQRAEAIGILNGTIAARGPGLEMTIRDPDDEVRVADILDAIQELRGAGAETMQIGDVRVGVSTAVTGEPGALLIDGRAVEAPYEFVVIGDPQGMETAMNIPGGAVQRITGRGGSVTIRQSEEVVVDALRPLDEPQYASPSTGG